MLGRTLCCHQHNKLIAYDKNMVNRLEDFHRYGELIPRGAKAFLGWLCNSTA